MLVKIFIFCLVIIPVLDKFITNGITTTILDTGNTIFANGLVYTIGFV
jgi:hypothetical protein